MHHSLILTTILGLNCIATNAQSLVKWSANFEPQKVFIENKGQFDNCFTGERSLTLTSSNSVLFGTEHNAVQILFRRNGVSYLMQRRTYPNPSDRTIGNGKKDYKEKEQKEYAAFTETDAVSMEWENANPQVQIEATEDARHFYNYSAGNQQISNARAFQKITYRNLYPGIDVEYVFHPKGGIEYNFLLQPGADASKISMRYTGTEHLEKDQKGNLLLSTLFGNIVDHAPYTFYASKPASKIASSFRHYGNRVTFSLGNYDKTKPIVIDPWIITPALPISNKVFCVKTDSSNNVYVYGGDSPFKLQKYNASGVLQWTYTTPWDSVNAWMGTLVVDKAGNSYITRGSIAAISKINTQGSLVWNNTVQPLSSGDEYWGLAFNENESLLLAGGTKMYGVGAKGICGTIYSIDLANGSSPSHIRVAGIDDLSLSPNEVRAICYSPNGNFYFMTLDTIGSITPTFDINFRTKWGRNFGYKGNDYGFTPQGHNVLCANTFFIYTSTGDSVQKRDIDNGALIASTAIPGGGVVVQNNPATLISGLLPKNGGIALDNCGNLYIGSQTGVYKMDANLNFLDSASTPEAVYALAVNNNGEVVASGAGFVAAFNMSACSPYLSPPFNVNASPINVTCSGLCNGKATVSAINGVSPFTYLWSNGDTSATVSGLCVGSYQVSVTDALGSTASTVVNIGFSPFALTDSILNTLCGSNTGAIGILSLTGVHPYSFSWSNGAATSSIFGLSPGIYYVTITDSDGCVLKDTFSVLGVGNSSITINANSLVICDYDSAQICAPAGYADYQWSNAESMACINTNVAGTYSVTVIDNANCIAVSNNLTISVLTGPAVTVSLSGSILTANVTGQATGYEWYRNDTLISGATSNTYTATLAGNYKVAVTSTNNCVEVSLPVYFSPCKAYFVLFPDLSTPHSWWAVNQTTGAQPISYQWSWGDGATSTGSFPSHIYASPGNYDICLSITDASGCNNTYCDSSVYLYKADNMVTVNVVNEIPSGIQENSIPSEMYLFPNPGSKVLNIRYRGLQVERVRLFNMGGQLISDNAYPDDNSIDVNMIPKGVYIAEVKIGERISRLKWTKK